MSLETKRQELRSKIPEGYNGLQHFIVLNVVSLSMIVLSAVMLRGIVWWELLFVPGFFVFANVFEWFYHKGPLHTPNALGGLMKDGYVSHAKSHHILFTDDDMRVKEWRDLTFTLFSPWFLLTIGCIVVPLGLVLGLTISWNLFWLFLLSSYGYYFVYEWLHTMHHWPEGYWLAETRLFTWLRQHHARHHNLRRMTKGNFNVSFPLADYLFGTVLDEGEEAAPDVSAGTPSTSR